MRFFRTLLIINVACLLVACQKSDSPKSDGPKPEPAEKKASRVDPAVEESLAKLSEADRSAAETQRVCPVSREPLGSMGVPVKVHVADQDVWLCCESCEKPLSKNPPKYLRTGN